MKKFVSTLILLSIIAFQPVCLAIENTPISITKEEKILKSKLKKYYAGYEYTITNTSSNRLNIVNAQIQNGTNGSIAYNTIDYSTGKAIGVFWAVMGPVGLFTLGIGWLAGIIGTPIVWICANHKDKKLRKESFVYTDTIPLGYIEPQENITVLTLIPLGAEPQVKITIYNDKSKDYQIINY